MGYLTAIFTALLLFTPISAVAEDGGEAYERCKMKTSMRFLYPVGNFNLRERNERGDVVQVVATFDVFLLDQAFRKWFVCETKGGEIDHYTITVIIIDDE